MIEVYKSLCCKQIRTIRRNNKRKRLHVKTMFCVGCQKANAKYIKINK